MIVAWFMRFGSLTLQTFTDVDDLAWQLIQLEQDDIHTFDLWGSFDYAVDGVTGENVTSEAIEAAKQRVRDETIAVAATYKAPAYTHHIYLKDVKGRWHLWLSLRDTSPDQFTGRLAGLLADGRAEIRPVPTKEAP